MRAVSLVDHTWMAIYSTTRSNPTRGFSQAVQPKICPNSRIIGVLVWNSKHPPRRATYV